jgi:uncharacterized membrane protein
MSKAREIRCYDYVNHGIDQVKAALTRDALSVFQNATRAAATRAESVAAELRVNLGALEVSADIAIEVTSVEERPRSGKVPASTCINLQWAAAKAPRLFPMMKGQLFIYPLTGTETQLVFVGNYDPPMGLLGSAMDAVVGHHIAEASVHRFLRDVAGYLRDQLPG